MARVLVSDPISEEGLAPLRGVPGIEVDFRPGLPPDALKAIIGQYEALAVRSETKVNAEILAAAGRLQIIGRAGVGVDNIDVAEATKRGIVVVNSPDGNTLAAAELTVGLILALARQIPAADATMRAGRWDRKKFMGVELFGKTVGIVGLGRIGAAVAKRLQGFEVHLISYNPFATEEATRAFGVEPVSLDDLLRRSDFITVHTPLNDDTRGLIGRGQFAKMKQGVRIINCARGGIIDEQALVEAAESGKVAGFAVDVFSKEPAPADSPLLCAPNSVLTPHLGASTREAQLKVAVDVAEQIVDVLQGRPARTPVNLQPLSALEQQRLDPYLRLATRIGSLQMQLASAQAQEGAPIGEVEVRLSGDFGGMPTAPITRAVLRGLLQPLQEGNVNLVNAEHLAATRGIKVVETRQPGGREQEPMLCVRALLPSGERTICGAVVRGEPQIIHIDGYQVDVTSSGHMIVTQHQDRPGVVGQIGTLLGENGINIGGMQLGRSGSGGRAVMVLMLDCGVPESVMEKIRAMRGLESAQLVRL